MSECEARGIPYLFKVRQTPKIKTLLSALEQNGGWRDCGQGFQGLEDEVRLSGWSCTRRVIVARRRRQPEGTEPTPPALPLLTQCGELTMELVSYDYIVLVTTLPYEAPALVAIYRERGDAENPFDELKKLVGLGRVHHAGLRPLPSHRPNL